MIPYAINLFWINEKLDNDLQFIYPSKDEKHLTKNFLKYILSWASANPLATTIPYHDSVFTSKEAPLRIQQVLELPVVKVNLRTFSDQIPLYYRVDLFQWLILLQCFEQGESYSCAIFTQISSEINESRKIIHNIYPERLIRLWCPMNRGPANQFLPLIEIKHKEQIVNGHIFFLRTDQRSA